MGKAERIDFIFSSFERGLSSSELLPILNSRLEYGRAQCKKGEQSVENVYSVFKSISSVESIRKFAPKSKENVTAFKDITVGFHSDELNLTLPINIQVKSSQKGIDGFYKKIGKNEKEIKKILKERKLIVLNGQQEPENILQDFYFQLNTIIQNEKEKQKEKSSVNRVVDVLKKISNCYGFEEIKKTPKFSYYDCQKKQDITFKALSSNLGKKIEIGVQVKSSESGVKNFLLKINKDVELAHQQLTEDRLILINGQKNKEIITTDFKNQLETILNTV